jgi:hypothetical protein
MLHTAHVFEIVMSVHRTAFGKNLFLFGLEKYKKRRFVRIAITQPLISYQISNLPTMPSHSLNITKQPHLQSLNWSCDENVNFNIVNPYQFSFQGSLAAYGSVLPGYPVYGQCFDACYYACLNSNGGCAGFYFVARSQFHVSRCTLIGSGIGFGQDGGCVDPDGRNVCYAFANVGGSSGGGGGGGGGGGQINIGIVDRSQFVSRFGLAAHGGTNPGFPVYGQSFDQCYYQCEGQGSGCGGFTFKAADGFNDKSICWVKPPGNVYEGDGICNGRNGQNLCYSYQRIQ